MTQHKQDLLEIVLIACIPCQFTLLLGQSQSYSQKSLLEQEKPLLSGLSPEGGRTSSVRELPAVGRLLANVLEDFGLLHFLGLLVAEPTAAASLLQLAVIAVHVQINKRRHLEAK